MNTKQILAIYHFLVHSFLFFSAAIRFWATQQYTRSDHNELEEKKRNE